MNIVEYGRDHIIIHGNIFQWNKWQPKYADNVSCYDFEN